MDIQLSNSYAPLSTQGQAEEIATEDDEPCWSRDSSHCESKQLPIPHIDNGHVEGVKVADCGEWTPTLPSNLGRHLEAELLAVAFRHQHISTPMGFDEGAPQFAWGDVVSLPPELTQSYNATGTQGKINYQLLARSVLGFHEQLTKLDTVYVVVDSRSPAGVDHFQNFAPWWASRRQRIGPAKEKTDIIWFTANEESGLADIPYIWAGTFVLEMMRFLYPEPHIILVDSDCTPVTLFEVEDLIRLSAKQLQFTPLVTQTDETHCTKLILFTEEFYDLNAGMVISVGERTAGHKPAATPPENDLNKIVERLFQTRSALWHSAEPPADCSQAAQSGLIGTPFLGIQANSTLDLVMVWAAYGLFAISSYWPIPHHWELGQQWPRTAHLGQLTRAGQQRVPSFSKWARATFEQGALAVLNKMPGSAKVAILPGADMFQAHKCSPSRMRPAIYHSFGKAKQEASEVLKRLARDGWQPLVAALLGTETAHAAWQGERWSTCGGVVWRGNANRQTLTATGRALLLLTYAYHTPELAAPPFLENLSFEVAADQVWPEELKCHPVVVDEDPEPPVPIPESCSAMPPAHLENDNLSSSPAEVPHGPQPTLDPAPTSPADQMDDEVPCGQPTFEPFAGEAVESNRTAPRQPPSNPSPPSSAASNAVDDDDDMDVVTIASSRHTSEMATQEAQEAMAYIVRVATEQACQENNTPAVDSQLPRLQQPASDVEMMSVTAPAAELAPITTSIETDLAVPAPTSEDVPIAGDPVGEDISESAAACHTTSEVTQPGFPAFLAVGEQSWCDLANFATEMLSIGRVEELLTWSKRGRFSAEVAFLVLQAISLDVDYKWLTEACTDPVVIDCLGLGNGPLKLKRKPHLTVGHRLVDGATQVYGPSLSPEDKYTTNLAFSALGDKAATHEITMLMLRTQKFAAKWAIVTGIPAVLILHRNILVLRAAKIIPAHRKLPQPEYMAGIYWQMVTLAPDGVLSDLIGTKRPADTEYSRTVIVQGFSAGSYTGALIATVANRLKLRADVAIGAIAMPPSLMFALGHMASSEIDKKPIHQVRLVHMLQDKLCRWTPDSSLTLLSQAMDIVTLEDQPWWINSTCHNYCYLLDVMISPGAQSILDLAITNEDIRPLEVQQAAARRLLSWMRITTTPAGEKLLRLLGLPDEELLPEASKILLLLHKL